MFDLDFLNEVTQLDFLGNESVSLEEDEQITVYIRKDCVGGSTWKDCKSYCRPNL